jgi:dTDP-4-amino-4,6-dideoxygalactose transaminase
MIPLFKVYMSKHASKNVTEVLNSGFIGQGPKVDELESHLKEWFHHDYLLTTNAATSAEHLAIHMLKSPYEKWPGVKEGEEVLCTPLTCTATNFPVLANGLKIKWVDVDENTLNMDLKDLERKLSPTTKIIYVVHWGGYPLDLDKLKLIQEKCFSLYGFKPTIIEDCAHAFGSSYKGKKIGSHGNICTFSFQAIKHMTCVDGGLLSVPHKQLFDRGKLLRWYGIDRENTSRKDFRCEEDIKEWGYKFHMNDVCASIGLSNLKEVDENVISKHKKNASYYNKELKNVKGITLLENKPDHESSYWIYTIKVDNRDNFMRMMEKNKIAVSRVHERNDKHTCMQDYISSLPTLDKVVEQMICIPVGWWVTKKDREHIVNCIKKGW